jgi:uncharacterized cofD-like protein
MTNKKHIRAVVMGGGTGTVPVVSALKHLNLDISTVIAVSDSGGSTGRIRDEFGFPPVGDLRQSLAALAGEGNEEWIRKILLYRFSKGEGLKGHNLGNLLLTAIQDMTGGDTTRALEIAEKIFRIEGTVIPVTQENVGLEITYTDGSVVVGEDILDQYHANPKRISKVKLIPSAPLNPQAESAIENAELIVIGPGDYYASIMAALIADGTAAAFAKTNAKVVYVMNLMTRNTQTKDMTAKDHVRGIEAVIGRPVDVVLVNNEPINPEILAKYAAEDEFPVVDNLDDTYQVIRQSVVSDHVAEKQAFDTAHRSLLRHDSQKLSGVFAELLSIG